MGTLHRIITSRAWTSRQARPIPLIHFSTLTRLHDDTSRAQFPFPAPKKKKKEDEAPKTKSIFNNLPPLPSRASRHDSSLAVNLPKANALNRAGTEMLKRHSSFSDLIKDERSEKAKRAEMSAQVPGGSSYFTYLKTEEPRLVIRPVVQTGRTIHVSPRTGLERAFDMLSRAVVANRIPQTANLQRFHERKGLRRKRLRMSRWRRRFGAGFNAAVTRVQKLVRQGW